MAYLRTPIQSRANRWECSAPIPSGLRRLLEQFAADKHAPDLARSRADFVEFGIAQQAAGGIVVDVAVATQTLIGFKGLPVAFLAGLQDCASGVLAGGLAAVAGLGDGLNIGLGGIHPLVHFAILPCIIWNSPMALPNCLRSWT